MSTMKKLAVVSAAFGLLAASSSGALAQKKYDTGATDTEIKIGNIMPYSGPASAYGVIGKTEAAYFKKINDEGGINGRKINFISYDDGYSPPKTVEQARKLVESDEVLFIFNSLGTPPNSAIHKYMNSKKVPQLFVATGATKWNDPKDFPWTMGWQPNYQSETQIYAKYILKNKPNAKIAVLYQNDDYGKDYLKGLKDGLGAKAASMIVAEESYETTEPTIDTHIVKLKSTGADVFINITTPKFAAQAIKKIAEIGWKPLHFLNNVSASVGSVIKPAGYENAQGIISAAYLKDASDPQWDNDAGMKEFHAFMAKYFPEGDKLDGARHRRLRRRADAGPGAEAVRRQPHPREHHEAGGKPEGFPHRSAAARHQDQHQPDRFRADQPAAADEVQGREVGAVRRRHQRRRRRLTPSHPDRPITAHEHPRGMLRGFSFARDRMDNRRSHVLNRKLRETMTDRRPLLRAIFDAAVAAAHPDVVLAAHLRPAPKGRVICLAAGKGAAAMAAAAERHYLDALGLDPSRLLGIATTRHGHGVPTRRIRVIEAGHPVPDEAGLKGAEDSLRLAAERRRRRSAAGAAVRRRLGELDRAGRRRLLRAEAAGRRARCCARARRSARSTPFASICRGSRAAGWRAPASAPRS